MDDSARNGDGARDGGLWWLRHGCSSAERHRPCTAWDPSGLRTILYTLQLRLAHWACCIHQLILARLLPNERGRTAVPVSYESLLIGPPKSRAQVAEAMSSWGMAQKKMIGLILGNEVRLDHNIAAFVANMEQYPLGASAPSSGLLCSPRIAPTRFGGERV